MIKDLINKILALSWDAKDSEIVRLRKSAMTGFSLSMCCGGILWGLLCLVDQLYIPSLIPFGYSLIILPSILLSFKLPHRYSTIANFQLSLSLFLPFMFQWLMGGFFHTGTVMLWACSALLGSILIVGAKKSLYWYLTYVVLILVSTFFNSYFTTINLGRVSLDYATLSAINVLCVTTMAYFVTREFSKKVDTNQIALLKNIKNLKENLDEAYQKTLQSDHLANMGKLAASIGHEINNPLAISNAYLNKIKNALEEKGELSEELKQAINKQTIANQRIKNIVQGLRVFARKESQFLEVIELNEVLGQAVDLLKEIYEKEQINFIFNRPNESLLIKGDIGKLQQVIFNLLQNAKDAIKDNPDKKIELHLQIQNNQFALIKIKDNGHGIPHEIKEKIFEPFFTTKKAGSGTGIGLGVVHEIIQELSGSINVESEEKVGTEFNILFPLAESSNQKDEIIEKNDSFIDFHENKKVLVVEDEEDLREILCEYLEVYDCQVAEACNGEEAIQKIKNENFDLIFTDLTMPEMDGYDLIRKIIDFKLTPKPLIILVTGVVEIDSESNRVLVDKYVDAVLTKPYEVEDLEHILNFVNHKQKKAS